MNNTMYLVSNANIAANQVAERADGPVKSTLFGKITGESLNAQGLIIGAVCLTIVICYAVLVMYCKVDIIVYIGKMFKFLFRKVGVIVNRKEQKYHRDVKIGKINSKRKTVKWYRFLSDLVIDLGLKRNGATPYSFLASLIIISYGITLTISEALFKSFLLSILMLPIAIAFIMCVLYTKANVAHDARVEAVIESENIISNNIKGGVIPAIRNSVDLMPLVIRPEFIEFIDNIEQKNYHVRVALMELNNSLGTIADDFIKKCIEFETSEEHGIAGMFQDVVEVNNVKMEARNIIKRKFEEVTTQFIIGALMIFIFLGGVLILYKNVREFYFFNTIGQIVLCIDMLVLVAEFMYITWLRARNM